MTSRNGRSTVFALFFLAAACGDGTASPPVTTATISIAAPSDSLFLGRRMLLTANTTKDSTGTTNPAFVWTSSDTAVVVVDSLGSALAVGTGVAQVTVSRQGAVGRRSLRVILQRADNGVTFSDGSANDSRNCAIASGSVYCRAEPTATDSTPLLRPMPGAAGIIFTAVEGSLHAACALATDGRVLCWGNNAHNIFARGGAVVTDTGPVAVSTTRRFASFTHGGHAQTCGVERSDSTLYCWGHNDAYQLGRGFLSAQDSVPAPVGGALRASMVHTVNFATCLLNTAGAAYCSGSLNANRQYLGVDESFAPAAVPLPVMGGIQFKQIAVADQGACGLSVANDAYCWGVNTFGQLGIGTTAVAPTGPQRVLGGVKFARIETVYRESTCGISTVGDLYCWGQFRPLTISARLGTRAYQPYQLIKGVKFKAITRGIRSICGVTTNGNVLCWS